MPAAEQAPFSHGERAAWKAAFDDCAIIGGFLRLFAVGERYVSFFHSLLTALGRFP